MIRGTNKKELDSRIPLFNIVANFVIYGRIPFVVLFIQQLGYGG